MYPAGVSYALCKSTLWLVVTTIHLVCNWYTAHPVCHKKLLHAELATAVHVPTGIHVLGVQSTLRRTIYNGEMHHDHVMGRAHLFVIRLTGERHKGSLRKGMGKPRGCCKFYSILP